MTPKDEHERIQFAAACALPENGEFPEWLKTFLDEGYIRRALRDAGADPVIEVKVAQVMLGLDTLLFEGPPPSAAEIRKDLNDLIRRTKKFQKGLRSALDPLRTKLLDEEEVLCDAGGQPTEVVWSSDPFEELLLQLDRFLAVAENVKVPQSSPGARRSPWSLAVLALVNLVLDATSTVKRPTLSKLAKDLLGHVMDRHPKHDDAPDDYWAPAWNDRVGEAVKERMTPNRSV